MGAPNNSAWAADFLFVGRAMAARLAASVPALRESLMVDEIEPTATRTRQVPAALVMLHDQSPDGGGDGYSDVSVVRQQWLVFLVDKTGRNTADRGGEKVGPLLPQIVQCLHGWRVPGTSRNLAWAPGAPTPKYFQDGTVMFPLLFSTQFSV
ncbi:phage tail terminator protein [Vitreoscilla filiformis]|nr:hypothetical protein [Vitreoscilla filiformis]